MTFEEAKQEWPEAAVVEDVTMDLSKVLRRRLVEPARAPGEQPVVVWEDESL